MTIKNVFWDLDGTLIDSNVQHAKAWYDTFEEAGHAVPYDKVRRLVGVGGPELVERALGRQVGDSEKQELLDRKDEIFAANYRAKVEGLPRAGECVGKLKTAGIWQAIVTGSGAKDRRQMLADAKIPDAFDAQFSSSEVSEPKPSPQIIEHAIRKAGVSKDESVFIGDTIYDLQAAQAAGVPFFGVLSGGAELSEMKGADQVFKSAVEATDFILADASDPSPKAQHRFS